MKPRIPATSWSRKITVRQIQNCEEEEEEEKRERNNGNNTVTMNLFWVNTLEDRIHKILHVRANSDDLAAHVDRVWIWHRYLHSMHCYTCCSMNQKSSHQNTLKPGLVEKPLTYLLSAGGRCFLAGSPHSHRRWWRTWGPPRPSTLQRGPLTDLPELPLRRWRGVQRLMWTEQLCLFSPPLIDKLIPLKM